MKSVISIDSIADLNHAIEAGVNEVIISTKEFSRLGKFPIADLDKAIELTQNAHTDIVFNWDILMTDDMFMQQSLEISKLDLKKFKAIRLQDPGALEYILETTNYSVQWIVETGNHNLIGLKSWVSYIGNKLDRLVLSIEIPKERLQVYLQELSCDTELLVLGRILLFYTPRNLLTPLYHDHDDKKMQPIHSDFLMASGNSEESPHKGFPIVENRHGTYMFHIKDHYLMENLPELREMKLNYARIDLSELSLLGQVASMIKDGVADKSFKDIYPKDVIRGFYSVNKTDILFKKLKNHRIQRQDKNYRGKVLESLKESHLAIQVQQGKINCGDQLKFISPEGKMKELEIKNLRNIAGKDIESLEEGEIGLIKYHSGIIPMTVIYQNE